MIGDQEYWGLGIGGKILDFLITRAKVLKLNQLSADIKENNTASRRLLERGGFISDNIKYYDPSLKPTEYPSRSPDWLEYRLNIQI